MVELFYYDYFFEGNEFWVLESDLDDFTEKLFAKKNHSRLSRKIWERVFQAKIIYKPHEYGATNRFKVIPNKK